MSISRLIERDVRTHSANLGNEPSFEQSQPPHTLVLFTITSVGKFSDEGKIDVH